MAGLENTGFQILEKFLSTEETHHAATADIASYDNNPYLCFFVLRRISRD